MCVKVLKNVNLYYGDIMCVLNYLVAKRWEKMAHIFMHDVVFILLALCYFVIFKMCHRCVFVHERMFT